MALDFPSAVGFELVPLADVVGEVVLDGLTALACWLDVFGVSGRGCGGSGGGVGGVAVADGDELGEPGGCGVGAGGVVEVVRGPRVGEHVADGLWRALYCLEQFTAVAGEPEQAGQVPDRVQRRGSSVPCWRCGRGWLFTIAVLTVPLDVVRLVIQGSEITAGGVGGCITVRLVTLRSIRAGLVGIAIVVDVAPVLTVVTAVVIAVGGVVLVVDGAAVAAGLAPTVAVGGVAMVHERLRPLD